MYVQINCGQLVNWEVSVRIKESIMSRKERNFKRSFGQEKARVKLYKSGKQWIKAGIREVQLLKVLGLPFLNKDVEQINNLDTNKDKILKIKR